MATGAARNVFKLYVGNLPWTVGNNELKQYFSKFGHIQSVQVSFDRNTGLSRHFGFVLYSNREAFETALGTPSHKLEGNTLKVQVGTDSPVNN